MITGWPYQRATFYFYPCYDEDTHYSFDCWQVPNSLYTFQKDVKLLYKLGQNCHNYVVFFLEKFDRRQIFPGCQLSNIILHIL